jgi:hypothetical protein
MEAPSTIMNLLIETKILRASAASPLLVLAASRGVCRYGPIHPPILGQLLQCG